MANEKVYVGEEGAKELYRKIKALIPGAVTVVDEVSLNSMDAVTSHAVAVAIGNLTGFRKENGTGADNHPNVNTPNTRTIYLVKIPEIVGEDKYKEWIWVIPEQGAGSWECIGSTSIPENAWKQWSEDNGSSGVGDSVYLGKNNTLTRNDTYALGKGNTAISTDNTDYSNTDVVMLGTSNSATNAAYAYQLGKSNTVTGNSLASGDRPYTSVNIGTANSITNEGVNIGKLNSATNYGISIGEGISSDNAGIAIGRSFTDSSDPNYHTYASGSGVAIGNNAIATGASISISSVYHYGPNTASTGSVAIGVHNTASNESFAFGKGNYAGKSGFSIGLNNNTADINHSNRGLSFAFGDSNVVQQYGFAVGRYNRLNEFEGNAQQPNTYAFGEYNTLIGSGFVYGSSNTVGKYLKDDPHHTLEAQNAFAIGNSNNVVGHGFAVGWSNSSKGNNSILFGDSNTGDSNSIVVGLRNIGYEESSVFGVDNKSANTCTVFGRHNTIGTFDSSKQEAANNQAWGTILGENNTSTLGGFNVLVGLQNNVGHEAVAIGTNNTAYGYSWVIGKNNHTPSSIIGGHATIIGYSNTSTSTLYGIQKYPYVLLYGMPLNVQQSILSYSVDFSKQYGEYVETHTDTLAAMKADLTAAYNLMDQYITDDELDTAYNTLINLSDIDQLFSQTEYYSVFSVYWYNIGNSVNSPTPGMVRDTTPVMYENNSIIMGVGNTSNHYNSILIGLGNTSLAPAEEVVATDDDGFTVAIGYNNTVERNYDMAIGYQSVAKGGENIAITNSEAVGYRNLAYNHSKVNGICNILLNESVLDCKRWDDEPLKIEYNTFNTLNNSNVSYKSVTESEGNTGVTFFGNHFEGVRCELVASAWGVHANVMLGNGPRIDDSYSTWSNDPDIKIAAGTISNNIIADSKQHFEIALGNKDSSNSIEQNLFMFNDVQMYNIKQLRQNMFISSVFNVEMDSNAIGKGYFYDNIIANSTVTGRVEGSTLVPGGVKANTINHNVILGKSNLCLNNTPGTVEFNVLLGHSTLDAYHEKPIWSNSTDGIKCNFLFGSSARKAHDCVSFGDGGGAYLENAMHSRNFGDNTLYNTNKVFVAGDGNALNAVQHSVVFGETNEFNSDEYYGRRDLSAGNVHMSEIFVHGISNKFNYTGGSSFFSRLFVAGNANTVNGNNVHDSSILGSNNTIGWFENGVPVKKTCEEVWSFNANKPTIIEVTDRGYLPSNGTSTVSVYSGDYYYYRGGAVYEVYSATSYTSISGNDFVQKVRNKELVDNSYYYITSSVQGDKAVLQLNAIKDYSYLCEYYTKYPDGTVRSTSLANMGTHILGCQAQIAPNVMWSTILGAEHKVTNSLPYGISGLLVQGMGQTVSDGSNIICMGAGNVSSGHGSIAIGNQLISDKWQTVIGKYNKALPGPERTIPKHDENKTYNAGDIVYDSLGSKYYKCTSSVPTVGMMQNSLWTEVNPDSEKALFIVGNGYGESDSSGDWNDESKIHRSNAMEVYADGTVKAHDFVSDNELTLDGQNGVTVAEDLVNSKLVVSLDTDTLNIINFFKNRPQNGTYSIQNTNGVLSWVQIGIAQVPVQSQTV